MLRKVKIESVNGINVIAGGNSLRCIGNKTVRVGDYVWTDGRCVYGFERTPTAPFVPTVKHDSLVIFSLPIAQNQVSFTTLWKAEEFKTAHQIAAAPFDNTAKRRLRCVKRENGNNKFALIVCAPKPRESTAKEADALAVLGVAMLPNTDDTQGCRIITSYQDGTFYEGDTLVFALGAVVRERFDYCNGIEGPDYYYYDPNIGHTVSYHGVSYSFMSVAVDVEGNFYGLVRINVEDCSAIADETTSSNDTYTRQYVFIKNDEYTVLVNETTHYYNPSTEEWESGIYSPNNPSGKGTYATEIGIWLGSTWEKLADDHSFHFPVNNDGDGGYFSFAYDLKTTSWIASWGTGLITQLDSLVIREVKFWDSNLKELFSLTKSAFVNAVDSSSVKTSLSKDELLIRLKWQFNEEYFPSFDFYKLAEDDFLILLQFDGPTSWQDINCLFRYRRGGFSFVGELHNVSAIVGTTKQNATSILHKFAMGLENGDDTIFG